MDERTSSGLQRATDGELVGAAKCGNEEAFERLFVRYERRVFAVAQRIVKNREDAEDIAQECFKKAFLHLGTFQHKSQFSTWLTRIAMNEAFMMLRRRKHQSEVSQGSLGDVAAAIPDQTHNPEQSCRRRELKNLLADAIDLLSPKLRSAILLFDIAEYSVREAARIQGASKAAMKSRLHHGHRKLRISMNPQSVRMSGHRRPGSDVGVQGYEPEHFAEQCAQL